MLTLTPTHTYTSAHTHVELQSADGSLNAVLESPKVEGSRRRPRWKWSPISTQILTEAFKKVCHFHSLYACDQMTMTSLHSKMNLGSLKYKVNLFFFDTVEVV